MKKKTTKTTNNAHVKTIDTKITTEWGVKWSPFEIARDFVQNFFDENPPEDINIRVKGDKVTITAPQEFDTELLDYLVSFKGEGKIGRYGEGFKAATLNALRDHGCRVSLSGNCEQREWFLKEKELGGRLTRVVMCKVSPSKKSEGTELCIDKCPPVLAKEFRRSLSFFYYPENPLFGTLISKTYEKDIMAYRSTDDRGYVFYGKILRSVLDAPIVLVCNRHYKKIDEKIEHDRDRKAFSNEVLGTLLKLMVKNFGDAAPSIVELLEHWWAEGHIVLSSLSGANYIRRFEFPDKYFARSTPKSWEKLDIITRIKSIEEEFLRKGYVQCPGYMANLGMKSARSVIEAKDAETRALHSKIHIRKPNKVERRGLKILTSYIEKVHTPLANIYANAEYKIGSSDELLGELRKEHSFKSKNVYLSRKVFVMPFAEAVSVLLHEWAHVYGFDGSRDFTDALTEAIARIIMEKDAVSSLESEWEEVRSEIRGQDDESTNGIFDYIDQLTNKQKTKLLQSLPEEELLRLLRDTKLDKL